MVTMKMPKNAENAPYVIWNTSSSRIVYTTRHYNILLKGLTLSNAVYCDITVWYEWYRLINGNKFYIVKSQINLDDSMRSHALGMGIDCWWSSPASFQDMHRGSYGQVLVLYVYGPTIEKLILLYGYWDILGKLEHNRGCWYSYTFVYQKLI